MAKFLQVCKVETRVWRGLDDEHLHSAYQAVFLEYV